MKNILMPSMVFLMLATAASIFQMTSLEAQTVGAITQLNKLVYAKKQYNQATAPPLEHYKVYRVYQFSETPPAFTSSLQLQYEDAELKGIKQGNLVLNSKHGTA